MRKKDLFVPFDIYDIPCEINELEKAGIPIGLQYRAEPVTASKSGCAVQKGQESRLVLSPVLDLAEFKASSLIDWVELRVFLRWPKKWLDLRYDVETLFEKAEAGTSIYVSSEHWKKDCLSKIFRIRIQDPDPKGFAGFLEMLRKDPKVGIDAAQVCNGVELGGVEISQDFYPKKRDGMSPMDLDLQRYAMTEALKHHTAVGNRFIQHNRDWPRTCYGKRWWDNKKNQLRHEQTLRMVEKGNDVGLAVQDAFPKYLKKWKADAKFLDPRNYNGSVQDGTFYIGRRNGVQTQRIMNKTTDQRSKWDAEDLPPAEWRSRIETTFRKKEFESFGDELFEGSGLRGPEDLIGYNFSGKRKDFFDFHLPTIVDGEAGILGGLVDGDKELEIFKRAGVVGLNEYRRRLDKLVFEKGAFGKGMFERLSDGKKNGSVAWKEMNKAVERSLRRMSKRWDVGSVGRGKGSPGCRVAA